MNWDTEIEELLKENEVLADEYKLGVKSPVFFTIDSISRFVMFFHLN